MYTFEPSVAEQMRKGRLKVVLEPYAPTVPGFFLYYPSRAQSSPALRAVPRCGERSATPPLGMDAATPSASTSWSQLVARDLSREPVSLR